MPLFPLFADLSGREVLVVGGGAVAARKTEALLNAGARVLVHAPALDPAFTAWLAAGRVSQREGAFDPGWLDQVWLLVAATDDREFNARLAEEAGRRRCLANIVDDAELSTFQVPAVVDRAPLQVAISSGGAAPMLARQLRARLEAELDPSLGALASLFAAHRDAIRHRLPVLAARRRWFERVLEGPVPSLLRSGRQEDAERALLAALQFDAEADDGGSVALVGGGDGDPGNLTLGALRALNRADLILHGADVSPAVIALARRDAERGPLSADVEATLERLVGHVAAGQRVVCLKPGDAFRRAPDDGLARRLVERGIVCEVVPGVASR